MNEEMKKQMIYLATVDLINRMLRDGVLSKEVLERLNKRNAESLGCKPILI